MPRTHITQRLIDQIKASKGTVRHFDVKLSGFALAVYPSGKMSFLVRKSVSGKDTLITIGQYPALSLAEARDKARAMLNQMYEGRDPKAERSKREQLDRALSIRLGDQLERFLAARSLKSEGDYRNCIRFYMKDWVDRPIRELTRRDYEDLYLKVCADVSQATATKLTRYVSSVLNWTMADEVEGERLLTENVTLVIAQKRYATAVKPRKSYLNAVEVEALLDYLSIRRHPQRKFDGVSDQGAALISLLLYTGMRKGEALGLRWDDVDFTQMIIKIRMTKNGLEHLVPMSGPVASILNNIKRNGPYLFPSPTSIDLHLSNPSKTVANIVKVSGVEFTLHDLRRTFATHARMLGLDYDLVRRSLNHKSGGSITDQYIVEQVELIRPVFEKIAEGFEMYSYGDYKAEGLMDNLIDPVDMDVF